MYRYEDYFDDEWKDDPYADSREELEEHLRLVDLLQILLL